MKNFAWKSGRNATCCLASLSNAGQQTKNLCIKVRLQLECIPINIASQLVPGVWGMVNFRALEPKTELAVVQLRFNYAPVDEFPTTKRFPGGAFLMNQPNSDECDNDDFFRVRFPCTPHLLTNQESFKNSAGINNNTLIFDVLTRGSWEKPSHFLCCCLRLFLLSACKTYLHFRQQQ